MYFKCGADPRVARGARHFDKEVGLRRPEEGSPSAATCRPSSGTRRGACASGLSITSAQTLAPEPSAPFVGPRSSFIARPATAIPWSICASKQSRRRSRRPICPCAPSPTSAASRSPPSRAITEGSQGSSRKTGPAHLRWRYRYYGASSSARRKSPNTLPHGGTASA